MRFKQHGRVDCSELVVAAVVSTKKFRAFLKVPDHDLESRADITKRTLLLMVKWTSWSVEKSELDSLDQKEAKKKLNV